MPDSLPRLAVAAHPLRSQPALVLWAVLVLCAQAPRAHAQGVKPWTPASADSVTGLVAEAKVRFRQVEVDTIDDDTVIPFERVGQTARRLMRGLGRQNTLLAPSIEGKLDSLGLDIDVVNDPEVPSVVL